MRLQETVGAVGLGSEHDHVAVKPSASHFMHTPPLGFPTTLLLSLVIELPGEILNNFLLNFFFSSLPPPVSTGPPLSMPSPHRDLSNGTG